MRTHYHSVTEAKGPQIRPMIHCNEHLQVMFHVLKCVLCDSLCHTTASTMRLFFSLLILLYFILGEILQGQRVNTKGQGNEWDWDASCEIHKESIKFILKKNRIQEQEMAGW